MTIPQLVERGIDIIEYNPGVDTPGENFKEIWNWDKRDKFPSISADHAVRKDRNYAIRPDYKNVDIDFDVTNYSNFKLMLEGWNPSADCNMYCRFKINGSISTGSNYCSLTIKKYAGGFDSNEYGGANQNYGYMTHNVGGNDGTYETYSAQLEIMTGSGTGMPFMNLSTMYKDNNATYAHNEGVVAWQNHNQIQGIRIYPSTGTITAGKYTLYGF